MKVLVVERPHEEPQVLAWNEEAKRIFALDKDDIECLEHDQIVFKLDVALSLEDE